MPAHPLRRRMPTRESAKLRLRSIVGKVGVDIGRDPFVARVVRALRSLHVDTVLDVGANQGQYGQLLRNAGFEGRLVSYEPLGEALELLRERASRDGCWEVVGAGMGDVPSTAEINVSANSYSSSLLPMTHRHLRTAPDSAYEATEVVELRTVDAEVGRLGLDPRCALLKVDTQGYEAHVLRGAAGALEELPAVQLELSTVDLYQGQARAGEMTDRLTAAGFVAWNWDAGISDAQGRLLQYDALFVRPDRLQP